MLLKIFWNQLNTFMHNVGIMVKYTLKILQEENRKIFKVCWPFLNMHERFRQISNQNEQSDYNLKGISEFTDQTFR